jgi:hypothetical protein
LGVDDGDSGNEDEQYAKKLDWFSWIHDRASLSFEAVAGLAPRALRSDCGVSGVLVSFAAAGCR